MTKIIQNSPPGTGTERADRLERMTPSAIRDIHELGVQLRLRHPERTLRALHVGEGNLGTPEFIVEAGVRALRAGAVFYEANRGRPDLTGELAAHYQRLYGVPLTPEHFVVSSGGVQAILLTMLGLLAPGDQVINITPAWPNFREAALIAGGEVHDLALRFDATRHRFTLDLPSLETLAATLPTLRMVVVNSPSNPTGCVLETSEKRALLEFCHRRGLVLLADEMYDRLVYRE
ncbi:MAG: aminotransferase class I/II-fold pyridoxal phosphate-dependent enzyme, partial [Deltaproteobacteria bacterium]|nr:aminotransferase class I/II-fold pyridoxal phosphate-dependent enzyme [Deltaproteobacteria bacterium]